MATIKQIAARVGVTDMTVSRVLNGGYVAVRPAARERADTIRRVAAELGYRPNASARATRRGRHQSLALLVGTPTRHTHYHDELLDGLQDACERADCHLILARLSDDQLADERRLPRVLRELSADGLLVKWFAKTPEPLQAVVERHTLPTVWLARKREHDCVYNDEVEVGRHAAKRLLAAGHRDVAFIDQAAAPPGPTAHHYRADRRAGYAAAMIDAGLEPRFLDGRRLSGAALRPFTGVIAGNARVTQDTLYTALAAGRSIPGDLSLVVTDVRKPHLGPLDADVARPRSRALGVAGVELLMQKIQDPARRLPSRVVGSDLLLGDTVAPPTVA